MYCVACNCAKKHTSNTNDYIRRVSGVKTRPETTTTPRKLQTKSLKRLTDDGTSLDRLIQATYDRTPFIRRASVYRPKKHFILNEVMRQEEGYTPIQAQCVDLSIKLIPTQANTHQSSSCCGSNVGGTGERWLLWVHVCSCCS